MKRLDKRSLLEQTENMLNNKHECSDMLSYLLEVKELIQKYSKPYTTNKAKNYLKDYYNSHKDKMKEYNRNKYREKMKAQGKEVKEKILK